MIKSEERFNELSNNLLEKIKEYSSINNLFIDETLFLKSYFKLNINQLEEKLIQIKNNRDKFNKLNLSHKIKVDCSNIYDEILFFINDLIMNRIIENI